ncbi:MAG TPA: hypothetical protein VMU51_04395 [Mycobacteriales bacterium]|nr:hypothetical protein [Mycobacteriales bacterium]
MRQDFTEWLSGQLAERALGKVLLTVTALLGAAGTVGTLFGSFPLRAAALAAAMLATFALVVLLPTETKAVHGEVATTSKLLHKYCALIEERSRLRLEISSWVQTVVVSKRGDALVTRRLTLTPAGGDLRFLTCNLRYYGTTPLTPRLRRLVTASAREISVDGVAGARFIGASSWRSDTEHQYIVDFGTPVAAGTEVRVEVQWIWPLYSMDLMQGGVENFDVRFDHPTDTAKHEVILLKRGIGDRFLVSRIGHLTQFESHGSDLSYRVAFLVERPRPAERAGVRIDKAR